MRCSSCTDAPPVDPAFTGRAQPPRQASAPPTTRNQRLDVMYRPDPGFPTSGGRTAP
jgi:hypothetical protein